jgi:hypothetical protein
MRRPTNEIFKWVRAETFSEDAPTGPLDDGTREALRATTEALLDVEHDARRYADYFEWRATHLRGYRALYERFARAVDEAARDLAGAPFARLDRGTRARALGRAVPLFETRAMTPELLADKERARFFRYVIGEVLLLFAHTDALLHVGYDSIVGAAPAGLESYRHAVKR